MHRIGEGRPLAARKSSRYRRTWMRSRFGPAVVGVEVLPRGLPDVFESLELLEGAGKATGPYAASAVVAILMSVVRPRRRRRWQLSGAAGAGCCQGFRRRLPECTAGNPAVLPADQVRRGTTHPFRVAEEM